LLIVAEMPAIPFSTNYWVGNWNVNGTVTRNCPPKFCDAVLWNHVEDAAARLIVKLDCGMLNPEAVLNVMFSEVKDRVVVNPMTSTVKEFADELRIPTFSNDGAAAATLNCAVVGLCGVRSMLPVCVANVGVNVYAPATVPV
jgi:hypothetical protein